MEEQAQPIALQPARRDWRPLCSAMALLVSRSEEFVEELQRKPGFGRHVAVDLAMRLTSLVEPFDQAWLRLRAWIEDGKVAARGTALDRRRFTGDPTEFNDTWHTHGVLPPEQAAGLVLWDEPSNGEIWLRPNDLVIFGQGRHWKSVEVHWASLLSAVAQETDPSFSDSSTRTDHPPKPGTRKRGRKPRKLQLAVDALSKLPREELDAMLDKQLEDRFGEIARRTWLKKAREMVLQGISDK